MFTKFGINLVLKRSFMIFTLVLFWMRNMFGICSHLRNKSNWAFFFGYSVNKGSLQAEPDTQIGNQNNPRPLIIQSIYFDSANIRLKLTTIRCVWACLSKKSSKQPEECVLNKFDGTLWNQYATTKQNKFIIDAFTHSTRKSSKILSVINKRELFWSAKYWNHWRLA